jgi:hypothetical protein
VKNKIRAKALRNRQGKSKTPRLVKRTFRLNTRLVEWLPTVAKLDKETEDQFVASALASYMAATVEYAGHELYHEMRKLAD